MKQEANRHIWAHARFIGMIGGVVLRATFAAERARRYAWLMMLRAFDTTTFAALAVTWLYAAVACENESADASREDAEPSDGGEAGRRASAGSSVSAGSGDVSGAPQVAASGQGGSGGGQAGDAPVPPTGVGVLATPLAAFASSIAVNTHVIYYVTDQRHRDASGRELCVGRGVSHATS